MFRIIRFDLLVKYVAYFTVAVSILLYSIIQNILFPDFSIFKIVTIASLVSAVTVFLLLTTYFSRKIWWLIGVFDKSIFPDLNGTWSGKVIFENGDEQEIRAVIRQSLLSTQIDVHGQTMKSITLETTPTIEQGQQKLYYVYRSTPRDISRSSYHGSTLFDIRRLEDDKDRVIELSGQYYTDRKTRGRIVLRQVCGNSTKDVSYY